MKLEAWGQAQLRRIDALSIRERAMLCLSSAVAMVALGDVLVWSPALAEREQLAEQLRGPARKIDTLRVQLAARHAGDDASPDARQRRVLDATRRESATLDQRIRTQLAAREEIASLPAVIDRLLARHERLTLVRLSTAAPAAGSPTSAGAAMAATMITTTAATTTTPAIASPTAINAAANAPAITSVRWHGVDLSVAGRYADLVGYLGELEREMPGLRWGALRMATTAADASQAADARPVLTVRLTLPGDSR